MTARRKPGDHNRRLFALLALAAAAMGSADLRVLFEPSVSAQACGVAVTIHSPAPGAIVGELLSVDAAVAVSGGCPVQSVVAQTLLAIRMGGPPSVPGPSAPLVFDSGTGEWTGTVALPFSNVPRGTFALMVIATDSAGDTGTASMLLVHDTPPPGMPTHVRASATASAVHLTWTAAPDATSYVVKRSTLPGAEQPLAAGIATTAYTDTAVTAGGTYYYVVSSANALGESANSNEVSATVGRAAAADFDGDRKSDIAVYRPSTGTWWVLRSNAAYSTYSTIAWGLPGDVQVAADYDGDGRADPAIYRPTSGEWWILWSSSAYSTYSTYGWGLAGDLPIPADYDGDGRTDLAIYRPSTGEWWILWARTNYTTYDTYGWGLAGDIAVPADYDGDDRADLAIYRPSTAEWWVLFSRTNYTTYATYGWGMAGDVSVPADYDGDGRADIAIYRPGTAEWWVRWSSANGNGYGVTTWGLPGDVPVPADYDGDGKTDVAIYRPSTAQWWILWSHTGFQTYAVYGWGIGGDVPVTSRGSP